LVTVKPNKLVSAKPPAKPPGKHLEFPAGAYRRYDVSEIAEVDSTSVFPGCAPTLPTWPWGGSTDFYTKVNADALGQDKYGLIFFHVFDKLLGLACAA
jgi:hypothetical protein